MLQRIAIATVAAVLIAVAPSLAEARGGYRGLSGGAVHVHSYYRSNGTYVAPYTRSSPGTKTGKTPSYSSGSSGSTTSNTGVNRDGFQSTPPTTTTLTTPASTSTSNQPQSSQPASSTNGTTTAVPALTTGSTNTFTPVPVLTIPIPLDPETAAQRRYGPMLSNARGLIKAGIYTTAAQYLRRIMTGAPRTRIAATAQAELAALPVH